MSAGKICPFMSKPDGTSNADGSPRVSAVYCQKDRCMAWYVKSYDAWIDNKQQQITESGCGLIQ